jgi:RimJ/RimL family protein N-acetyltransferase
LKTVNHHWATSAPAKPTQVPKHQRVPLSSSRILFEPFTLNDVDELVSLYRNKRVTELVYDGILKGPIFARIFISRVQLLNIVRSGLGSWKATSRVDGQFFGFYSLLPVNDSCEVQVGAMLNESTWGQGLSIEGVKALLTHGFNTLQLERIWASCHPDHRGVMYVLATLGFDRAPDRFEHGQKVRSFVLTKTDWLAWPEKPSRRDVMNRLNYLLPGN